MIMMVMVLMTGKNCLKRPLRLIRVSEFGDVRGVEQIPWEGAQAGAKVAKVAAESRVAARVHAAFDGHGPRLDDVHGSGSREKQTDGETGPFRLCFVCLLLRMRRWCYHTFRSARWFLALSLHMVLEVWLLTSTSRHRCRDTGRALETTEVQVKEAQRSRYPLSRASKRSRSTAARLRLRWNRWIRTQDSDARSRGCRLAHCALDLGLQGAAISRSLLQA